MIYADVTATAITRILITHFHGDHCLGLAGMSQRISLDRVPHPVHVYFPQSGRVYYDRLRRASIYHDVAEVVPHGITEPGVIHEDARVRLHARRLDHGVETFGYRWEEKDKVAMLPEKLAEAGIRGPAIGELQRKGQLTIGERTFRLEDFSVPRLGQKVAFVMDTRFCEEAIALAEGVDMLVCESTYLSSEAREAHDHGHMTAAQAATIAKEAGARQLVLTHFSQRYTSTQPFVDEAAAIFPHVVAARDTKRYPIPKREGEADEGGPT
jgi:ribonuclease Z